MIKYIFYKLVQISVLIYIPFCFAEHVASGQVVYSFITFIIMKVYLDDLHDDSLEKELHGELY